MPNALLILFYLVFISQIILLSYYIPNKYFKRMKYVTEKFPPSKYPKLYPNIINKYKESHTDAIARRWPYTYRNINVVIFCIGFLLLGTAFFTNFSPEKEGEEVILAIYTLLQLSPFMYLSMSEFRQFSLMRKTNVSGMRKADLEPRSFFDFISPITFGIAVILLVSCIFFTLYINEYEIHLGGGAFITLLTLVGVHLFFVAVLKWQVFGKKMNPHVASKDRINEMKIGVKSAVYASIAMSIFLILQAAKDEFNMHYMQVFLMSIYFQVIASSSLGLVLREAPIEDVNLEVYKKEQPVN